jgi:hypothetical protein
LWWQLTGSPVGIRRPRITHRGIGVFVYGSDWAGFLLGFGSVLSRIARATAQLWIVKAFHALFVILIGHFGISSAAARNCGAEVRVPGAACRKLLLSEFLAWEGQ